MEISLTRSKNERLGDWDDWDELITLLSSSRASTRDLLNKQSEKCYHWQDFITEQELEIPTGRPG